MYAEHQFSDAEETDEPAFTTVAITKVTNTLPVVDTSSTVTTITNSDDSEYSDDYYDEDDEAIEDDLNAADAWAEATGGNRHMGIDVYKSYTNKNVNTIRFYQTV
jgi:hypothetical protein